MRNDLRRVATAVLLTLSFTAAAQTNAPMQTTSPIAPQPTAGVGQPPQRVNPVNQQMQQTIAQKIAASKTRMDINTATAAQLKTLPGIGDTYAQRIIAGRPYTAKNQLVQRGVIPQNVYAGVTDLIIAHRPQAAK